MNKLKNVVMVCEFAQFSGGSQNIAINSALELAKRGLNVYFVTAIGEACKELSNSSVRVIHFHIPNITTDINRFAAVKRGLWNSEAAREFEITVSDLKRSETVVHIHSWSNAFSSSIVKKSTDMGFKTFVTLHDYLVVCPNGGFYNYNKKTICRYEPMSLRCILSNCDRRSYPQKIYRVLREIIQNRNVRSNANLYFITISNLNESLIKKRVKSEKFFRINNFVNVNLDYSIRRYCEKSFIFVGRIVEEKGADIFCEAIRLAKSKDPEIKGIVLGDGPQLNQLRINYPEVDFEGWVNREAVDLYMEKARCLVFSSLLYECSPLTIIEALSKNLPCIVSDCTAATEWIKDGKNGYVYESGDPEALCEAIMKSINDEKYEQMITGMHRWFDSNEFTCTTYANNVLKVFNEVLNEEK